MNIEIYSKNILKIIEPSTELFSIKNKEFHVETECLFGEEFEVLKIKDKLCYGRLLTDNYKGWLSFSDLGNLSKANHRVLSLRTIVYEKEDIKSKPLMYLPLGSQIHVSSKGKTLFKILLDKKQKKFGYVSKQHLIELSKKIEDWVTIAESFVNTPYKWGGRNSLGIDCSALVQLSLQAGGIKISRNSSEQKLFGKLVLTNLNNLERGNLIFWDGHVGIIIDNDNMVHSNMFNMKVSVEKIIDVVERIGKPYEIYKLNN